jgi:hypothetical protein
MKRRFLSLLLLAFVSQYKPAWSQNLILNGSFELGTYIPIRPDHNAMSLNIGSNFLTNWDIIVDEVAWVDNANNFALGLPITSPFGQRFLDFGGQFDIPPFGGVKQTISTVSGNLYNLKFYLGSYEGIPGTTTPISVTTNISGLSQSFTANAPGGFFGNYWQEFNQVFQATNTSTEISFIGSSTPQFHLGFDNVSVVSISAPEPSSLSLFLFCLPIAFFLGRIRCCS